MPVTIVRPFNVYGPGQRPQFLIPHLIAQALDASEPAIVIDDPRPRRDFVHVDDVIVALCAVPVTRQANVYNVGSGRSHSVGEVAELIRQATGTSKPIVAREAGREQEIADTVADISAIRRLGWEPRIALEQGLQALVAEARERSNAVV